VAIYFDFQTTLYLYIKQIVFKWALEIH